MLDVKIGIDGDIRLEGRFDAAQVQTARAVFDTITTSARVDFSALEYISSAGLEVLLATQRRLMAARHALTLVHLNPHIRNVFRYAGFEHIFKIE